MQEQFGETSLLYITLKRSTIIWTFFYAVSGHCKTSKYFVKEVDFNIRLSESVSSVSGWLGHHLKNILIFKIN